MSKHLGSSVIVTDIEARIQTLTEAFRQVASTDELPTSAADLEAREQQLQGQTRELSDLLVAHQVQQALNSAELGHGAQELIRRQPGKLRDCGRRLVRIRFAGGTAVHLSATYYARKCDQKRASGKRKKGMFPGLYLLGIHERCTPGLAADQVLFVADGARWIGDRVKPLLAALGLKASQHFELIDFYHAVEHLSAFARLKPRWSTLERDNWVRKQRRRLRRGHIEAVVEELRLECKGTKSALLRRERDYFIRNQMRMHYGKVSDAQMPIGSGAMESSIRRVVNMRLKGAGIFWNEDTANEMLMLRCYYKAGRWDDLKKLAFQVAA